MPGKTIQIGSSSGGSFDCYLALPETDGKVPAVVLAHTVKGKGVSFMEGDFRWHSRVPTDDELATALAELADPGVAAVEA